MGKIGVLYIGIDCGPGAPRPDTYIKDAARIMGIKVKDIPPVASKVFGAWSWYFPEFQESVYDENGSKLMDYFNELHANGKIRGAEWDLQELSEEVPANE
jgi:DNA topoisomerase IB